MSKWIVLGIVLLAGCVSAAPIQIPQEACTQAMMMLQSADAICQVRPGQNGTGTLVFECLARDGNVYTMIAGGKA
jgi:hypothetical protein